MKFYQIIIVLAIVCNNSVVFSEREIPSKPVIYNNSTTRILVAREGQPVKLECLTGGSPAPTVSWTRNGIIYKDNILNILALKKRDQGIYTCVAENNLGEKTYRRINIKVEFVPIVNIPCSEVVQSLHYEANLECITEAYPIPFVVWMKDGNQIISDDTLYSISQSITTSGLTYSMLKITLLQNEQFGIYTCKALNYIGSAEAYVHLIQSYSV